MVTVLTLATDRNKYVDEFEMSLIRLGYNYKLLGMGQKWEGFHTKMGFIKNELIHLNPNQLVIICDSYDLVFLQPPNVISNLYHKLAKNKVVIGLESIKDIFCKFIDICIPETIEECKINNPYYPDFKYINAGFIMGKVKDILEIYTFMINNKFKDDQKALFTWVKQNCNKCYFDYHLDFVFNYMPEMFIEKKIKVEYLKNKIKVNKDSYPCAVHTPGQYLDLGLRTENLRNFLFPKRKNVSKIEYFKQCYKKSCTPEAHYVGYWWWLFFFVIIFIIIFCTI